MLFANLVNTIHAFYGTLFWKVGINGWSHLEKWFIVHLWQNQEEVKVIAGNGVFICNECVALSEIIREK